MMLASDRIRWGIAATGGIARSFAAGLAELDDAETIAVASRSVERAERFGSEFEIRHRHASYEALAEDPDVDIVYIASPQSRHEADTMLFLEAGKAVLCEKPFALNTPQATRMVEAARARGLFLMEAMWSRFLPSYRTLARLLDERVIGEALVVDADLGARYPKNPTHRLFDLTLGGGALLDVGIYPLQLASFVFGPAESVQAAAQIGDTGIDEQVAAVLSYAGDRLAVVKAAIQVNLECTARITGTEGAIELPAFMHCPNALTVTTSAGVELHELPIVGQGLRYQVVEVHRCLREGLSESPTMPLSETLSLVATMDRIRAQIGVVYPGE